LNIDNRPQRRAADLADALGQDAVERLGDVANGGLGQNGQDVERGGREELFWGIPFRFDGRRRSIKPKSSVVGSVCNPIVGIARSTDR
jgi:hypothetical protein